MTRWTVICLGLLLSGCGRGKSTGDWISQLKEGDAVQRLEAVKALGEDRAGAAEVVPALAEALKDANAFVRRDAARALGKLGREARPALSSLVQALWDRERSVRQAAAAALKQIDPKAAPRPAPQQR